MPDCGGEMRDGGHKIHCRRHGTSHPPRQVFTVIVFGDADFFQRPRTQPVIPLVIRGAQAEGVDVGEGVAIRVGVEVEAAVDAEWVG